MAQSKIELATIPIEQALTVAPPPNDPQQAVEVLLSTGTKVTERLQRQVDKLDPNTDEVPSALIKDLALLGTFITKASAEWRSLTSDLQAEVAALSRHEQLALFVHWAQTLPMEDFTVLLRELNQMHDRLMGRRGL